MDYITLEEKLITQAKRAAELIKNEIPVSLYDKLCSTIALCQNYVEGADGLGCKAENDHFPEDLELVIGERIPDFAEYLEENLKNKEEFDSLNLGIYRRMDKWIK